MAADQTHVRFAERALLAALDDTPAVLIHGPRQCGKTTLAQQVGEARSYRYLTFDDEVTRGAAVDDPVGFVAELPDKTILDEVQRVPSIFTTLKAAIDRQRKPGRFLLTGSTNVLLLPTLSDSLAGRLGVLRLHPLAQCELAAHRPRFLDHLFDGHFALRQSVRLGAELIERVVAGGYPAALARATSNRRAAWYRDYIETLVQRDVSAIARIASLRTLPQLLALAAGQTSRLINVSDLASPFQVTRQTIRDYVTLLERVFLLEELPPWHTNRLSRLVKTAKLHVTDTGVACALLGATVASLADDRALLGQLVETFVVQELKRHASWREEPIQFSHFRDRDGAEIDLILESGPGMIAGVEIKASSTVTAADFRTLNKLQATVGKKFAGGAVLYDGELTVRFGERLYAVPIRTLWE